MSKNVVQSVCVTPPDITAQRRERGEQRRIVMVTAEQVKQTLVQQLQATDVAVIDTSGGCGASFDVAVVADAFEGKTLIARHRLVHDALSSLMPDIHALSIKRCWTQAQQAAATQQQPAGATS